MLRGYDRQTCSYEAHRKHSLRPYRKICSKRLSNPRRFSQVPHIGSCLIFYVAQQPLWGQGLLNSDASRSYSRHTALGRIPLDESAHCTDLYLTKHNTHKKDTFWRPAGFKSAISANERPQTHALVWAVTGIGIRLIPGTKQDITFL